MSRYEIQAPAKVVAECLAIVAPAEVAFRSRWRMSTLERVDAELHGLLCEQIDLYSTALISGSADELREQSGAMVRGWAAGCRKMEGVKDDGQRRSSSGAGVGTADGIPHDAYLTGLDWETKTRVVISDSKQSIQHVPHREGVRVLVVSPDEVARLFGGLGIVSLTKDTFPNAELISIGGDENTEQAA